MVTEGNHRAEYDASLLPLLLGQAVNVLRAFGFAGRHATVVGGLAPSLLVPTLEPGIDPHVGTQDLDFCLSVALVEGDVGEYERLEASLRRAGFEMARDGGHSVSWRWRGGAHGGVTLEFFCPAGGERRPGRLYRPGGVVGGKLSAMVLDAGALVDRDQVEREVEVVLPEGSGRTKQRLQVAGPAAYLATKANALRLRHKNKDAYDVIWLIEAWPGGQVAFAEVLRSAAIFNEPEMQAALQVLSEEFGTIDAAGARKYATFMLTEDTQMDTLARQAVGAVDMLMRALST